MSKGEETPMGPFADGPRAPPSLILLACAAVRRMGCIHCLFRFHYRSRSWNETAAVGGAEAAELARLSPSFLHLRRGQRHQGLGLRTA
jgi:hypothetical protein